jgi:DNA-binding SARP family transcriptional activator
LELRVRLVGEFAVEPVEGLVRRGGARGAGGRKARALLALLAVAEGRPVPVDRIVAVLWAGHPPRRPEANVATLVSRLRAAFGPEIVVGGRGGYRLGDDVRTDLEHAAGLVREAENRLARGEPSLALDAARRGLETAGASAVLADQPDADWAGPARARQNDVLRRGRAAAAEAALRTGEHRFALAVAETAAAADPLDEAAGRTVMRAAAAAGEPARALAAYERLGAALARNLGVDPAPATRALWRAIRPRPDAPDDGDEHPVSGELVGREHAWARLVRAWREAEAGRGSLVLVTGEPGIGRSRLVAELAGPAGPAAPGSIAAPAGPAGLAAPAGGVVPVRCYPTERSLLLQPVVEMLTRLATGRPAAEVRRAAGGRGTDALAALVPEIATLLGQPGVGAEPDPRWTLGAVVSFLRRLAAERPLLLVFDDLQYADGATLRLLGHLARPEPGDRLLTVGTVCSATGRSVITPTGADVVEIGPLDRAAVTRLAAGVGRAGDAAELHRRTAGHTASVVELLRAGGTGVPATIRDAVLARIARAGPETRDVLRAAAAVGSRCSESVVAALLGVDAGEAGRRLVRAAELRLLVRSGDEYAFANELIREVVRSTTPLPTRITYHRGLGGAYRWSVDREARPSKIVTTSG